MSIQLNNYQNFLSEIQKIISTTQQKLIEDLERRKVEMSWQIGKNIEQHLLKNNRANYGEKLILQLSSDLRIAKNTLYQMRAFYKAYPKLPESNLNWTHYRNLIAVKNEEKRQFLENLSEQNSLSVKDLQAEIKKEKKLEKTKVATKKPIKLSFNYGRLWSYKIQEVEGEKFLDLGFNVSRKILSDFKDGELVETVKKSEKISLQKSNFSKKEIYTYLAHLERVVDGDTIVVRLDLGFDIFQREILRLAKIDAAPIETKEGKLAAKKLTEILAKAQKLIVRTNKTDIFGRYIADVFLEDVEGQYLNQMLLDLNLVEIY
jgi:hypothetical protein